MKLPKPEEIPNIEMEVCNYHHPVLGELGVIPLLSFPYRLIGFLFRNFPCKVHGRE